MRVDTNQIRRQTDLLRLVGGELRRVAGSGGGEWAGACPFCGGKDRFRVQPHYENGGRWLCRQCTDGKWGDAIDFVMRSNGLDFRAACDLLTGGNVPTAVTQQPKETAVPVLASPPSEDWQTLALTAVAECADTLLTGGGMASQAWSYLRRQRGLSAETIKRFTIGYNRKGRRIGGKYWLEAGIVIPVYVDGHLWAVNVRATKAAQRNGRPKYMAMAGSVKGALFNGDALLDAHSGIIVEGEFDAMLLSQFSPDGVGVATMGSASTVAYDLRWRRFFGHLHPLRIVLDDDEAGQTALAKWRNEFDRFEPMPPLPSDCDVTDAWRNGFDLADWANG